MPSWILVLVVLYVMNVRRGILILFVLYMTQAQAIDNFYHKKAEGWFWYEEFKKQQPNDQEYITDPVAIIDAYQKRLDFSLKQALVAPTIDNVANYLQMQQQLFRNSHNFATTWKRTLMYYPELDPTVKHPISHLGKQIYLSEHEKYINSKLKDAAKDYGLIFFFQSKCVYCHEMATTVKNFAESYNWEVLPVTLDGKGVPTYPDAKANNGISDKLNIYAVPAIMLTNHSTNDVIPITFGLISEQELIDRISLALKFEEKP